MLILLIYDSTEVENILLRLAVRLVVFFLFFTVFRCMCSVLIDSYLGVWQFQHSSNVIVRILLVFNTACFYPRNKFIGAKQQYYYIIYTLFYKTCLNIKSSVLFIKLSNKIINCVSFQTRNINLLHFIAHISSFLMIRLKTFCIKQLFINVSQQDVCLIFFQMKILSFNESHLKPIKSDTCFCLRKTAAIINIYWKP